MDINILEAIGKYQCAGCTNGSDISCYEKGVNAECGKHSAGTNMLGRGWILLGMPIGFNRLGQEKTTEFCIFDSFEKGWRYDKFNYPVWKHLNSNNHTLVRGICPRVGKPFIHVFLEDCIDKIDCLEITIDDISEMD